MTIKTLNAKTTNSAIAWLLDVTEGAVRYHVGRMAADVVDGRSKQTFKAEAFAEAIELWRSHHAGPLNLGILHEWLRAEHGYDGSVRSVQRYWRRRYPAPAIRARRRVETPAGAQAQVDWAAFPGVNIDGAPVDLLAMVMAVVQPHTGRRLVGEQRHSVLADLPLGLFGQAGRRSGNAAYRQ